MACFGTAAVYRIVLFRPRNARLSIGLADLKLVLALMAIYLTLTVPFYAASFSTLSLVLTFSEAGCGLLEVW